MELIEMKKYNKQKVYVIQDDKGKTPLDLLEEIA